MRRAKRTKLVLVALFTTIGVLLQLLFNITAMSEYVFLPLQIPILLCGIICGWKLGAFSGIVIPLLAGLVTGRPPMYPVGIYMMLELATYGAIAGMLANKANIFVTLLTSMLGGRIVLAIAQLFLLGFDMEAFAINAFLTETFVIALPGIVIQLILIPLLIVVLTKAKRLPIKDYSRSSLSR